MTEKKLPRIIASITVIITTSLFAQMNFLHGDYGEIRKGLHDGNRFRTTFYNDGTFGRIDYNNDIAGEWPAGTGHLYLIDGNLCVGSEVLDNEGTIKHIVSEVRSVGISYSSGDQSPAGEWWTFLPLPGFAKENMDRIAMSHIPASWPGYWPDKYNDSADPGWRNDAADGDPDRAAWNGYFGKNQFCADQESYFVADDYANREFNFFPDTTDPSRRGLGLRMYARGFQWSLPKLEDALFILFDFENIGTYEHNKIAFGYKIGNNLGETNTGLSDGGDDMGAYELEADIAYLYDLDDIGGGGPAQWPKGVGYMGAEFLETPGNPCDGIDNDGDGYAGTGPVITESMFALRTLHVGDPIIIIDYRTFARTITVMQNDTVRIIYENQTVKFWPGKRIEEIQNNLIDDNLNGIIDENNGAEFGTSPNVVHSYQHIGLKYINYFTGEGRDNPLIDERRDDGIDNDQDWNPLTDDVGADGTAGSMDPGEGNGLPTWGEPNFEKTDVHETDMLGLTSFNLYDWVTIPLYDDEAVWENLKPGYYNNPIQPANTELFFGSGYFSLKPYDRASISLALMCGESYDDLMIHKNEASDVYNKNYLLPRKPEVPTLMAAANGRMVTLNWNDAAELKKDPVTGYDFEGYRIYRSTDPGSFGDPIAQFDIVNEYAGLSHVEENGVRFDLGLNTGLQHSWVDTDVMYGYQYYYIVTSYDHGAPDKGIAPEECQKNVYVDASGNVFLGQNGTVVMPVEPTAKYYKTYVELVSGMTDGIVTVDVVDPAAIKKGHTYRITFEDSLNRREIRTRNFTLADRSTGEILIDQCSLLDQLSHSDVLDGFRLSLQNAGQGLLELNPDSSGWNNPGIYNYSMNPFSYIRNPFQPIDGDFQIIFGEVGIDTSTEFRRGTEQLPAMPVNFRITNTSNGEHVRFAFRERNLDYGGAGIFSIDSRGIRRDEIIFLSATDSITASWQIAYTSQVSEEQCRIAGPGDILTLKMIKPFLSQDVFEFTMPVKPTGVGSRDEALYPDQFRLFQNAPNPFNPITTIKYGIPVSSRVSLKIYNLMGQEVASLINTHQVAGYHQVQWKASGLPSGVYICRIQAGEYRGQKKMLLIK